jgi:capsular exopolysaccharide synthesis family protein
LALATLGGLAGAALAWQLTPVLTPAKYTARTKVHVSSKQPFILTNAGDSATSFTNYQRTQAALVTSRLVLGAVVADPRVAALGSVRAHADPVEWLEKAVKADFAVAPEIMTISLPGDNPDELVVVVDAIRDVYLHEIVNREQNELTDRLNKLKQFYADEERLLKEEEQSLQKTAKTVGPPKSLQQDYQTQLTHLGEVKEELFKLQSQLREAQVEAAGDGEKKAADFPLTDAAVEDELRKDGVYEDRRREVARLEVEVDKNKATASRPDQANLVRSVADLDAARKSLASCREKLRPAVVARLQEKALSDYQASVAQRKQRVAKLQDLIKEVAREADSLQRQLDGIKEGSVAVESSNDAITEKKESLKRIGDQIQALTVELQAPARVALLESAIATPNPDYRLKATAAAAAGGFLLLLFGVAWWEARARRVAGVGDVVRGLGMRLVATVPRLTRTPRGAAGGGAGGRGPCSESIEVARVVLARASRLEGVRVVLVTSAREGEGKTVACSELAISLARAGFSTLLIDGDLRKPVLHRLFGVEAGPGLNDLLRGQAGLGRVIRETEWKGLSVLPAGSWDGESGQGLAREELGPVLAALREQYEFILVDSSPILSGVDALVIGQHADAAIFSLLNGVSRMPAVQAACERAGQFQIRVFGAVLNGVEAGACEAADAGALAPPGPTEAPGPSAPTPPHSAEVPGPAGPVSLAPVRRGA